jgi:tRNA(Arg) A34 adenosine deaminase TadA
MCLGAIYWARPKRVIYANTKAEAASINFDDQFIYNEIEKSQNERMIEFIHHPHPHAIKVFKEWAEKQDKIEY